MLVVCWDYDAVAGHNPECETTMSVAVYGVAFGSLYGRTSIKCHCLVLAKLGSPSSLDSNC